MDFQEMNDNEKLKFEDYFFFGIIGLAFLYVGTEVVSMILKIIR